jgi:hypothetical protein
VYTASYLTDFLFFFDVAFVFLSAAARRGGGVVPLLKHTPLFCF